MATVVRAQRSNFSGDIKIVAENLPEGVKADAETMPGNVELLPVVFEAAPNAPIAGKLAKLTGKPTDEKTEVVGKFDQVVDLVTGGNNVPYYQAHVDRLALVVAEESPFKLNLVEPKVPLVQNGAMNLKVVAERKSGFTGPITVRMLFNPPGTNSGSTATIAANQNETTIPINASGGAGIRGWKVAVLGSADQKGNVWVSSQLVNLKIAEPPIPRPRRSVRATRRSLSK
jgi:hypothetical protein